MTPQEQNLIRSLFERIDRNVPREKDREAEDLIFRELRARPDAAYVLTQTVLVQENALERATARIRELEEQLDSTNQPSSSGSFLGGLFGGSTPSPIRTLSSVPPVPPQPANESLSNARNAQATSGGGGFLASALSTAAGVAGGIAVADSLRSLFGSHAADAGLSAADFARVEGNAAEARTEASHLRDQVAEDDRVQDELQDASDQQSDWSDDDGSMDV